MDLAPRYVREVERYNSAVQDWHQDGENIISVYLEEEESRSTRRRFPLLWASVDTLKPSVYARAPIVQCSRRYKDRDPTARTAAELIERATNTSLELSDAHDVFKAVRDDRLLPGRGQAWVLYKAAVTGAAITSETVRVEYVHWQDFGHNIARLWSDVWLVWRILYKTQDEMTERYGPEVAARLAYTAKPPVSVDAGAKSDDGEYYCKVYEFWDKAHNLVSWLIEGEKRFLESGPPPLNFSKFFPCPEPCYATKTSKSLIPRPDYIYYRTQAKEINDLTAKIGKLTQWLIVKGFLPGGPSTVADPLEQMIRDKGNDELFITVDSFTEWTEKGGAKGLVDWFPVENVINTLQAAIQVRSQLIEDVFQITGIGDILRGQTDPGETYGAVNLKAQTGSRRLRNTREEVARFCRDVARLVAEVIAENFQPETLAKITGYKYMPMMMQQAMPMQPMMQAMPMQPMMQAPETQTFDDNVLAILRDGQMRDFRVDVETDSTVQLDEEAEKEARREFVDATGSYLERMTQVVTQVPELAPTAGEMLLFAARGFRVGRTVEEVIERDLDALRQRIEAAKGQPQQNDPMVEVANVQVQGDIEKNRVRAQLDAQKMEQDAQLTIRKQNIDASLKLREQDIEAEKVKMQAAARQAPREAVGP